MLCPCPFFIQTIHRIPYVSPWVIFREAFIWKDIWVSLQGAYIYGCLIWGAFIQDLRYMDKAYNVNTLISNFVVLTFLILCK